MVPKSDRLGSLQVGKAGHDGVRFALGQVHQSGLQTGDLAQDGIDGIPQIETDVGGHLIVTGASGVQLLAGNADALGQSCFNIHVHVFQFHRPGELAVANFLANGLQAVDDLGFFFRSKHPYLRQHGGMGDGAIDVLLSHLLVKIH